MGGKKILLSKIHSPQNLQNLSQSELSTLANEIRNEIIKVVGKNGGHLASNLGVVELTLALHRVFESPKDAIIWDVSHQCYTHKLLTDRYKEFSTLRKKNGISGFTNTSESVHDFFISGHSSTSISSALGLLTARELNNNHGKVIAVIGDGALTGGMAYEALSCAGQLCKNLIVILNDNQMSIDHNTGAVSRYLSRLTMTGGYQSFRYKVDKFIDKIPYIGRPFEKFVFRFKRALKGLFLTNNLFVDLGFEYVGPLDGHNEAILEKVLKRVRKLHRPVVVHVITKKGKGYSPAENNPELFHGVGPFQISDGTVESFDTTSFTEAFSKVICEQAEKNKDIVAITAAMAKGTGLTSFSYKYPERFFDVGIAEEHAVTFAAGLAAGGMRPVVSVYSTFLQRGYDQILHDVCMNRLPVVFAVDRSGIVGRDGETHQGIFDLSYFGTMPNMTVLSPMDEEDFILALDYAVSRQEGPVAVRYPRGNVFSSKVDRSSEEGYHTGKAEVLQKGSQVVILAVGNMVEKALGAAHILAEQEIEPTVVNMRFVKPFDKELVRRLAGENQLIVTMEDNVYSGGFSAVLQAFLQENSLGTVDCFPICLPDAFISHGAPEELYEKYKMDAASVAERIMQRL